MTPNPDFDDDDFHDDGDDFEGDALPPTPAPAGLPLIDFDRGTDDGHYDPLEDRAKADESQSWQQQRAINKSVQHAASLEAVRTAEVWHRRFSFNPCPGGE